MELPWVLPEMLAVSFFELGRTRPDGRNGTHGATMGARLSWCELDTCDWMSDRETGTIGAGRTDLKIVVPLWDTSAPATLPGDIALRELDEAGTNGLSRPDYAAVWFSF
jgi:hypothetical protein